MFPSPPICIGRRAGTSSCRRGRCTAIRTTATHCKWLSTTSRTSSGVVRYALDHGYKGHRLTGHPHTAGYITGHNRAGDCCNALLAAAGFNLRQLLRFLSSAPYFFCARFYLRSRPPSILFRQPRPLSKSNNDFLTQLRQVGAIERFFEHILEVVVPRKIPNLPVCSEDPRCLSRGERKRVCSEDQPS